MTMTTAQKKRRLIQLYAQELATCAGDAIWLAAAGSSVAAHKDETVFEHFEKLADLLGYDITKREESELEAAE